jgi:hypothetical protein
VNSKHEGKNELAVTWNSRTSSLNFWAGLCAVQQVQQGQRKSPRLSVKPTSFGAGFESASKWKDEAKKEHAVIDGRVWHMFGNVEFDCDVIDSGAAIPPGRCAKEKMVHVCKYKCLRKMEAWEEGKIVALQGETDVEEWNLVIGAKMAANKKQWQADQDKLVAELALLNTGDQSHSIMTLVILEKQSRLLKEFHCLLDPLRKCPRSVPIASVYYRGWVKDLGIMMMRVGATVCRANDNGRYDPDYNVSSAVMKILEDDSYHREVANSVLMKFDVPAARGFGHMRNDHYSEETDMNDYCLNHWGETDQGNRGGGDGEEDDEDSGSETDDDDDKTVPMSLDGEDGFATQPEDDDSKCAMAGVGGSATDSSSVKSEDY